VSTLGTAHFLMAALLLVLGFFLIWPILLLIINSFNTASDWFFQPRAWGLGNWVAAFTKPKILSSLGNSILIWMMTIVLSFPVAVGIAWLLARTKVPYSHTLEFLFWVAFMVPDLPITIAWILLLDPGFGLINVALTKLPFMDIDKGPFNIFSIWGIVWVKLMGNTIAIKVMLLTPAFRNMDAALEEAGRVSGASNLRTALRITLPLMISPLALVFGLQLLRIFQSFETELLVGTPFNFFVLSTRVYNLVRGDAPNYGEATALASITLLVIALIIPVQRWIIQRRRYTTITGQFRPGLIDLGRWNYFFFGVISLLLFLMTLGPVGVLLLGSFMTRIGFFLLGYTTDHWQFVLHDTVFLQALRTTLVLATTAAFLSPLLFSILAYILVRTRLPGRFALDSIIWASAAIPGILSSLGLLFIFLGTPLLHFLYGTLWALLIVVILQGTTTGVNFLKGIFVQVGADMEEAARVSGAGWLRTFFRIWIPLLMPSLVLLAAINFTIAAGTTSPIILIASRDTITLSLLALEYSVPGVNREEAAGIISLFIIAMTVGGALMVRYFGLRLAVSHDMRVRTAKPVLEP
jgi:iron(III) transport system permease protein